MTFHPDKHLPGCMMPDGGDCCAGHAAVVEDWHKLREAIMTVLGAFEKDEAQGYRSRDRQYAISILRLAVPRS